MNTRQAFIAKIQAHQGIVNKIVFLYADTKEDRKDLRQEILAQAWRSYGRFRGDAKFSTWLYRVGLNVAISSLRKKRPEHTGDIPERTQPARSDSELLETILQLLNPVEKSLVLLLIEGYQQNEIAEMLDISPSNTRVKIHRIRKKLDHHGIKELVE